MRSQGDHLVKMANQIGMYFGSQHSGDPAAAAQAVASHLKLFWAPPMRQSLIDLQHEPAGDSVLPVVRQALTTHGGEMMSVGTRIGGPSNEALPEGGGDAG